jgi:hypothetical protein
MDENFDQLRKLLALKRYEQAPPGYFNNFSSKVIARIAAAEAAPSLAWWQKLGLQFDLKPALMCVAGVLVCGLLSAGAITSAFRGADQPPVGLVMGPSINSPAAVPPFNVMTSGDLPESTQPVFSASRFDQFGLRAATLTTFPSRGN